MIHGKRVLGTWGLAFKGFYQFLNFVIQILAAERVSNAAFEMGGENFTFDGSK